MMKPVSAGKDTSAVALFVDVDNIGITSLRYLNAWPDYRAVFKLAEAYGQVLVAEAFVRRRSDCGKQSGFFAALQTIGYSIRTQTSKVMFDGSLKAAPVDMDLAFRVGKTVAGLQVSTVVIASGDSDFAPICQELKQDGIRVVVIGPDQWCSPEIKRTASRFYKVSEVGIMGRSSLASSVA